MAIRVRPLPDEHKVAEVFATDPMLRELYPGVEPKESVVVHVAKELAKMGEMVRSASRHVIVDGEPGWLTTAWYIPRAV